MSLALLGLLGPLSPREPPPPSTQQAPAHPARPSKGIRRGVDWEWTGRVEMSSWMFHEYLSVKPLSSDSERPASHAVAMAPGFVLITGTHPIFGSVLNLPCPPAGPELGLQCRVEETHESIAHSATGPGLWGGGDPGEEGQWAHMMTAGRRTAVSLTREPPP